MVPGRAFSGAAGIGVLQRSHQRASSVFAMATSGCKKAPGLPGLFEEREKGFEPSTLALARRCSTAELFPHWDDAGLLPTAATGGQARGRMRGSSTGVLRCNGLPLLSGGNPPVQVRRALTLLSAALALLFGCGGDSGGGGSATISGKVVDDIGQPLANRTVLIGSISTTTDSSGAFTLKGVATPYDLTILAPAPTKF